MFLQSLNSSMPHGLPAVPMDIGAVDNFEEASPAASLILMVDASAIIQ